MQIANCKMKSANCRLPQSDIGADDSARAGRQFAIVNLQLSICNSPLRAGVTLVEILITILIISILAGLILGVAAVAGETAREAHTRHMITRLHTLLMEHYGTYKRRRVKLNPSVEAQINSRFANNASLRGRALAEARLYALREMMLMEVPDRWSDVLLTDVGNNPLQPLYLAQRTDLSNIYGRRYQALVGRTNTLTRSANTTEEITDNQGAECLYMIITLATGDGEARSLFGESNIGDVDGDGAPEFLDGWDHPIYFLRWAPGFDSLIQVNANQFSGPTDTAWTTAAAGDHDPFDVFRIDQFAFRLVPLIFSSGRDERYGLHDTPLDPVWRPGSSVTVSFAKSAPFISPQLTPYVKSSGLVAYLGTELSLIDPSLDRASTDNIHNHLLGLR